MVTLVAYDGTITVDPSFFLFENERDYFERSRSTIQPSYCLSKASSFEVPLFFTAWNRYSGNNRN